MSFKHNFLFKIRSARGTTFLPIQGRTSGKTGFTLIELMVTVAIFTIITTVVIYENSKFNSSVLLTNLSYQIALTIRQAQVYGVSSKKVTVGNIIGSPYQLGYGVHFNVNSDSSKKSFVLFADANNNGIFNASEEISRTVIGQNNNISTICFQRKGTLGEKCHPAGNGKNSEATIRFKRPNLEARIRDNSTTNLIEYVKIVVSPLNDATIKRCVIVRTNGQISVKGTGC